MKKVLQKINHHTLIAFLVVAVSFSLNDAFGQCSAVPVKEAVRNGDFEAGYIANDFKSDNAYAGPDIKSKLDVNQCHYGTGDKYYISDFEEVYKCEGVTKQGTSFSPDLGTVGKGGSSDKILYVDPKAAIDPLFWEQTVSVTPGQLYYFSFWNTLILGPAINYDVYINGVKITLNPGNSVSFSANVSRKVFDANGKVVQYVSLDPLGNPYVDSKGDPIMLDKVTTTAVPITWTQLYGTWNSGTNTSVKVQIKGQGSIPQSGADIALDDISFKNDCSGIVAQNPTLPDLGDDVNFCSTNGTLTLDSKLAVAPNLKYYWYKTNTSTGTETQIAAATANKLNIVNADLLTPDTYVRVCVEDNLKSCSAASDQIKISKFLTATLDNEVLCSPPIATLKPVVEPYDPLVSYTKTYTWSNTAGEVVSTTASQSASKAGNYSVTVSNPNVPGCAATATSTVTSKLPTAPTNLTYCEEGGVSTDLAVGDGKKYNWYKDAAKTALLTVTNNGTVTTSWVPPIGTTGDQTLYISNNETTPIAGYLGAASPGASYPAAGSGNVITLTVTQAVELTSFMVSSAAWVAGCGAAGSTTSSLFTIKNGATVIASKSVTINCGSATTVNFGVSLQPGTYTLNATDAAFYFSTMSGTLSNSSLTIAGTNTVFANIKTASAAACDPMPVIVKAVSCCTKPDITTQPASVSKCEGASASFTVEATGATLSYQWQIESATPGTFTDLTNTGVYTNVTTATMNISNITGLTGKKYQVIVKTNGTCPATSSAATLTVNPTPATPTITSNLTPSTSFAYCAGMTMALTAATTTTGTATWNWVTKQGTSTTSTFTANKTGITSSEAGLYEVTATINSCVSAKGSATVSVSALPVATVAATQSICSGAPMAATTVSLNPTTAKFDWNTTTTAPTGSATGASPTSGTAVAHLTDLAQSTLQVPNGTGSGTYTFTITPKDGACTGTAVTHVVTVKAKPAKPVPTNDGPYCETKNINLKSNVAPALAASWKWTFGTSTTSISALQDPTPFASTSASSGYYYVSVTNTNGCVSDTGTTKVVVNTVPGLPSVAIFNFCEDTLTAPSLSATVTPASGYTLTWYGQNATGGTGSATASVVDVTTAGTFTYYVTQKSATCESGRAPITVNIKARPVFTATGSPACKATLGTINFNTTGGGGSYTYSWTGTVNAAIASGVVNSTGYQSVTAITQTLDLVDQSNTAVLAKQVYTVMVHDANGCTATDTANIVVNPCPYNPDFSLAKDTACLKANAATVTITPKAVGATSWTWDFGPTADYTTTQALTDNGSNGTAMNANSIPAPTSFDVVYKTAGDKKIILYVKGPGSITPISKELHFYVGAVPVVTVTGNSPICSNTKTAISLTADVSGSTFSWVSPIATPSAGDVTGGSASTGTPTTIAQTLQNTTSGGSTAAANLTYKVIATSPLPNSCKSASTDVVVKVNPIPVLSASNSNALCDKKTAQDALTAIATTVSGSTITWTSISSIATGAAGAGTVGASGIINEALHTTNVQGKVSYTLIATSTDNCKDTLGPLDVLVNATPKVTPTDDSIGVCSGTAITGLTLASSVAGATMHWTAALTSGTVTGFSPGIQTSASITDNLASSGVVTYTINATNTTGNCTGPDTTVVVTVSPRPGLTLGSDVTICSSTAPGIAISSDILTTLTWTVKSSTGGVTQIAGASSSVPLAGGTATNTNATTINTKLVTKDKAVADGGTAGTVTYEVVAGIVGCQSAKQTVVVTVDSCDLRADFDADTLNVCEDAAGATVVFTDKSFTAASSTNLNLAWDFGTGNVPATATDVTMGGQHSVKFFGNGTKTVTLTFTATVGGNIKTKTKTLNVIVNKLPTVTNLVTTSSICDSTKTGITVTSQTGTTFAWTVAPLTGIVQNATASPLSPVNTTGVIDQKINVPTAQNTPSTVRYVVTPSLNGCAGTAANFDVTVEPIPVFSTLTAKDICSGSALNEDFTAKVNVANSTIDWTRASVTDISPATGAGANGLITETLSNSSSDPKTVTYLLTPTGPLNKNCKGKATPFKVTVAPIPTISSSLNGKVCSGLPYNYIAQSLVKKSTFTWTRAVGTNVTNAAATGSDSTISETLLNNTTQAGTVTYVLIPKGPAPTACPGVNANLTVTVNPLPKITSADKDTVCSNALFTYQITTGLATIPSFTWKRAQVGVNTVNQGTSNPIQETLISTSNQIATYAINATTAEGCTNVADTTLSVLISSLPTGKLSMPAQMCDGDTKELTATITGVAPFDYVVSGGGMLPETVTASSLLITKRNVTPGAGTATYAITNLKDATGCTSVSMSGISTQVNPLPKATIGLDQTICQGTSATLAFDLSNSTSTYDVTYQYYPVSSPGTITTVNLTKLSGPISTILVSPSNATVYKIKTVKDSDKGCPAVIDPLNEAVVTVTPRPNALVAAPVTSIICSGGTPNLSLSSNVVGTETGTSFKWVATSPSNKITGYSNSAGGNNTILDVIENDLGRESSVTYTITPTYLTCDGASIQVKINVRAKTEPVLVEQSNICPTTPITVKTSSFVGGTYTWNVDPPVPFTSTDENLTMTLNQDEMVQVVYEDICLNKHYSAWVPLKVKQAVTIAFTNGDICMASVTPFTPKDTSDASNKTEIDGWKWNFGNYITTGDSALSTKLHPETTFQYNTAGTYNVTLQAFSEGCEVGKVVQPIKIKDCTVKVTNTLTPNEDGSNDEWIINEIENYPTAGVEIFNRWGVLIWSCQGDCASKRFSGRNEQGQALEQGTYYYVLTLNKGKSIMRGYITIIRDPGN